MTNKAMAKKHGTKAAFLTSLLSLVLCVTMLIGTTLAWFTDTVTSGANQIVAGNLDLEVYYADLNDDGTFSNKWVDLQGSKSLFSGSLWEPGHTEVVYLKIHNAGTLDLLYKSLVTPVSENGGINVSGDSFKLSSYMNFTEIKLDAEADVGTLDRAAARSKFTADQITAAVKGESGDLAELRTNSDKSIELSAGTTDYMALIVYMPEAVGNAANYLTGTTPPSITLGITAKAVQLESESDSFSKNYDAGAKLESAYTAGSYYDYFEAVNATATASPDGNFMVSKAVDSTIIASASGTAAPNTDVSLVITKSDAAITNFGSVSAGTEVAGYDIHVTGQTENSLVQTSIYVGTGLQDYVLYHNNVAMTLGTKSSLNDGEYFYDSAEGYVYFASKSFSPFVATYTAPAASIGTAVYGTLADAVAAAGNADKVVLLKDITVDSAIAVGEGKTVSFDGNGHTVTVSSGSLFNNSGLDGLYLNGIGKNATLKVENVTLVSTCNQFVTQTAVNPREQGNATISFNNCVFNGFYAVVYGNNMNDTDSTSISITNSEFRNCNWGYSIEDNNDNYIVTFTDNVGINGNEREIFPSTVCIVYSNAGAFLGQYANLADAVNAVSDGDTVTMLKNATIDTTLNISKNVTINLNSCNITGNNCRAFYVKSGTINLSGTGTITSTGIGDSSSVIRVGDGADYTVTSGTPAGLVVGEGVTVSSACSYAVTAFGGATTETVEINGTLSVTGDNHAAFGSNGSDKNTAPVVTLGSNAVVTSEKDYAMYLPAAGTYNINGTVTGLGGFEIKAGTAVVEINSGAVITATATAPSHSANDNGTSTSGYAIALVENAGYGTANIKIKGGKVNGEIAIVDDDSNAANNAGSIVITGGAFSKDPSAYVANGYGAKLVEGTYSIIGLWSEYAATAFAAIDTQAKTITINSADQLALLAKNINSGTNYNGYTITIDGTLDMSAHLWVPMNAYGKLSGSTIIGTNNATVYGLDINKAVYEGSYQYYAAFIAQTTGALTIKDITFSGATSVSNGSGIAVVLGLNYGDITMDNVTVKDSSITAATKAGAFVGFTGGDGYKVTLKNCKAENVTVNSSYSYALMIGLVNIKDSAELTGCSATNCTLKFDETLESFSSYQTIGDLTYGVDDGKLWLTNPNGAWVEKRSNPSPTTMIDQIQYTIKGDKVLYSNGTIGEDEN